MSHSHPFRTATTNARETLILVVENDWCLGEFWHIYLQEERGYHVFLASTGREALHFVQEIHPQLIVIDLWLPDRSGVDLYDELHTTTGLETVPILLTNVGMCPDEIAERHLPFLSKPFDLETLDGFLATLGLRV